MRRTASIRASSGAPLQRLPEHLDDIPSRLGPQPELDGTVHFIPPRGLGVEELKDVDSHTKRIDPSDVQLFFNIEPIHMFHFPNFISFDVPVVDLQQESAVSEGEAVVPSRLLRPTSRLDIAHLSQRRVTFASSVFQSMHLRLMMPVQILRV